MRSTKPLIPILLAVGLFAAACGDDTAEPLDSVPTPTTPTTDGPDSGGTAIEHPTGADDIVVRIGYTGGFVPPEVTFLNLPTVLVTGDGRMVVQGPVPAVFPGPLLPNMVVRTVSETGVQQLLAFAAEHGLLAERAYAGNDMIADAPNTVVEIAANGERYRHDAYALGLETETGEARRQLAAFVAEVTGTWPQDNPELGPEEPFVADMYLVRATPVADSGVYEIEPTIVAWPVSDVLLDEAIDCVAIPAAALGTTFADASQLTFFEQDGVTYSLAVKPLLPGDGC